MKAAFIERHGPRERAARERFISRQTALMLQRRSHRGNLASGDKWRVIAPGGALVVDDVGHLGVTQCDPEGRHRARIHGPADVCALNAFQEHTNLSGGIGCQHYSIAPERRKNSGNALATRLVADGAVGREELRAPRLIEGGRGVGNSYEWVTVRRACDLRKAGAEQQSRHEDERHMAQRRA